MPSMLDCPIKTNTRNNPIEGTSDLPPPMVLACWKPPRSLLNPISTKWYFQPVLSCHCDLVVPGYCSSLSRERLFSLRSNRPLPLVTNAFRTTDLSTSSNVPTQLSRKPLVPTHELFRRSICSLETSTGWQTTRQRPK